MTIIKNIQPIGNVSFTEGNYDFPNNQELSQKVLELKEQDRIQAELSANEKLIFKLLNGELDEFFTCAPELFLKNISAQELQIHGVIITGFNSENPYGT